MPDSQHVAFAPASELMPSPPNDRYQCAVCEKIGREEFPGADTFEDMGRRTLHDACFTPSGEWVCGRVCLSQRMFEKASPREQDALRRYVLAIQALDESDFEVADLLNTWGRYRLAKRIHLDMAVITLGAMPDRRGQKEQAPQWIRENVAPEDRMRDAIGEVLHLLEGRIAERLVIGVVWLNNFAKAPAKYWGMDFVSAEIGNALGTLCTVVSKLKGAVAGEVGR